MGFAITENRSLRELEGVHSDLLAVVHRAAQLSPHMFVITDGKRSLEEQREYVAKGASRTMKSRHLVGCAVDFAVKHGNKILWTDRLMCEVADAFKAAAEELGVPICWGGDWKGSWDKPHIELDKGAYPDDWNA